MVGRTPPGNGPTRRHRCPVARRPTLVERPTTDRRLPHAEAGALISVQTRTGTYRFLRSGGDAADLGRASAPSPSATRGRPGLSTVTTVAPRRLRAGPAGPAGPGSGPSWWSCSSWWWYAVTLILLQSAGVIHLPFLGGGSSSAPGLHPGAQPVRRWGPA